MKTIDDTLDYYKIGERIRKYRKALGMSQEQLAECANISSTHMSHIETGNTKLSLPVLVDIANTLSVSTDTLIHDSSMISKTSITNEISDIINSCDKKEALFILETIKNLKISIDKHLL